MVSCGTTISNTSTVPTKTTTTSLPSTSTTLPKTTVSTVSTTTPAATTSGNWWDKLGKPQYGGDMVISIPQNIGCFDSVAVTNAGLSVQNLWCERLTADNWTTDPAEYKYITNFRPNAYVKGLLAEKWEFTDSTTYVLYLHQGVRWQDIPPVSGREFTAADVVYNYHRMVGGGDGFAKPTPYYATVAVFQSLLSVAATDKYTVVFKWSLNNPEFVAETMQGLGSDATMVAPEAIKLWGDVNDWHHAIGTGAFILTDFVSGSSMTLTRNPNYWGHDERYPVNQLPYADKLKLLIIPDSSTALAALRTGKIAGMDNISLQTAQAVQKTNPEILQTQYPATQACTIDPRNDVKPFTDINVRKALQMAIDLPTIAKTFYGGNAEPYPSTLTSKYMTGFGWPYDQWPQNLKDEYAYNPALAKKLLSDAGYPSGFKTDVVAQMSAADMDLMQIIKSYWSAIGVDLEIRPMESAAWTSFVRTTMKHDQLVASNGCLGLCTEPTRQLQRFMTGQGINWFHVSDPVYDAFFTKASAATNLDDFKKTLIACNQYVAQQHYTISLITPNLFALYQPWFKGYSGQNFSITGAGAGPALLGFYAPRFWIDQNLKKSMGQ
jgi:peptide/nickel transport system substrate-binding protein